MTETNNTTTRPANAKPWIGAVVYVTEVAGKNALEPSEYVVSDLQDGAFKVDGWKHWLPFSRIDYILEDFTTNGGRPDDQGILDLWERAAVHAAKAGDLEPAQKQAHQVWQAACVANGIDTMIAGHDARADALMESTGYAAARDVWEFEKMMENLCHAAILLTPANTIQGVALQGEIGLRMAYDVGNLDDLDAEKANNGDRRGYHERREIVLIKALKRVAAKQTGVVLPDLDLSEMDFRPLSSAAAGLRKLSAEAHTLSDNAPFIFRYESGPYKGAFDLNANGTIIEKIGEWADQQHYHVTEAIDAYLPKDSDEAYERAVLRAEWATSCGETLATIADIIAEGRKHQERCSPVPSAFVEELSRAANSGELAGVELTIGVLEEFRKLTPDNQSKAIELAANMVARQNAAAAQAA